MKISILMSTLNQHRFILTALGSILESPDVEIVVIDAGSIDGTRALLESLLEKYPNQLKCIFEDDSGPAEGLNKGIESAKGDIIGVLNSDDFYLPGAIDYIREVFANDSSIDIVLASGIIVDQRSDKLKYMFAGKPSKKKLALGVAGFFHQGMFFKRSSFTDLKFNPNNKVCWDYELIATMILKAPKVLTSTRPVAAFRIHNESITGTRGLSGRALEERKRIQEEILMLNLSFFDLIFVRTAFRAHKYLIGVIKSGWLQARRIPL